MNEEQFKELMRYQSHLLAALSLQTEQLEEIKKGIDTLVAAQIYSAELEERMMKALSGDSKKSTAQRSMEQMERMGR